MIVTYTNDRPIRIHHMHSHTDRWDAPSRNFVILNSTSEESRSKLSFALQIIIIAMSYAIGIDLGTVYSCVGVYKGGHVEIIANMQGNKITPSVVSKVESFTDRGRLVGDAAKNQIGSGSSATVYGKLSCLVC